MEAWRATFRNGLVPLLSDFHLEVLAKGLATDDARLIQGATTTPPPLQCVQNWPVEAACVIGYAGWQADDLITVAEVEEFFARMCFEMDRLLNEPAGCRHFLNWVDETPRDEMRLLLLEEIRNEQQKRMQQSLAGPPVVGVLATSPYEGESF
jgi:hypothetical protein